MAEFSLTIETLSGDSVDFSISPDTTVRETAEKIRVSLDYPAVDPHSKELINYSLVNEAGERIDDNAQLDAAGIHSGDRIRIRTTSTLQPHLTPTSRTLTAPGKLCLAIKMIGRSKPTQEQFDSDIEVGELLTQMIDNYFLPSHYDDNERIIYSVYSRGLSKCLENTETLCQAGVLDWDTLEILADQNASRSSKTKVSLSFCGLSLDELSEVKLEAIISNEPALLTIFHAYKEKLLQLSESLETLTKEKVTLDHLQEKLNATSISTNISTVLLILGQILVSFGTNLVTTKSSGGWLLFISGLAVDAGGLYFAFFRVRKSSNNSGDHS